MREASNTPDEGASGKLSAFFVFLGGLGTVALVLGELLAPRWWIAELAVSFRPHLAVSTAVAGLLTLVTGERGKGAALVVVGALAMVPLYPRAPSAAGTGLRVLSANVLGHGNADVEAFASLVAQTEPDVIGVLEVSDRWQDALEVGFEGYPYRTIIARPDNFGIALLSRYPYERHAFSSELPLLHVTLRSDTGPYDLVVAHPVPPVGASWWERRNARLGDVAHLTAEADHAVVLGDLNTSSASPAFRRLLRDGRLRHTARVYDGTFPARLGRLGLVLDYVLVGDGLGVAGHRVLEDIGSDHRPVLVDIVPVD